jgi:hypothetical protein
LAFDPDNGNGWKYTAIIDSRYSKEQLFSQNNFKGLLNQALMK